MESAVSKAEFWRGVEGSTIGGSFKLNVIERFNYQV
tara:strand:- start:15679 stop:15786 length:108 start_codon:yes stop_codon:yes gene_type:complete